MSTLSIRIILYILSAICGLVLLFMAFRQVKQAKTVDKKIEEVRAILFLVAVTIITYSGSLLLVYIMLFAQMIGFLAIRHYKKVYLIK